MSLSLEELKGGYASWDGFDDAILGIAERCSQEAVLLYDYESMIDVLMRRDGLNRENAEEYLQFNVIGAWIGDQTPLVFYE